MDVWIAATEDDAIDDVRRLYRWLTEDAALSRRIPVIRLVDVNQADGNMGPAGDAIQAILEQRELLAAFVGAFGAWLGTRQRNVKFRIRVDDKEVEIDAGRIDDPEALITRILRELDEE